MKLISMLRLRSCFFKTKSASLGDLFPNAEDLPQEEVLAVEKKVIQRSREVVQENQKVRNYLYHEYYRGEDFIEKIPMAVSEQYTVADHQADLQNNRRLSIEEVEPLANHVGRAETIRDKIAAYHDKQRKYEIEEFEKYLSKYPGTIKGPRPEDDWEAYRAYGLKKIPKILVDELHQAHEEKKEIADRLLDQSKEEGMEMYEQPRIHSPSSLLAYMTKDRKLIDSAADAEMSQKADITESLQECGDQQLIEDYKTEVPTVPNLVFEDYQGFMNHWMSWIHFRNFYVGHNLAANLAKLEEKVLRLSKSLDDNPAEAYVDLPANIPSLYRYYKCLPKSIQDHPGLKDIYLGLEYSSPDFPYEQKEQAINWTCPLLLPFDDISLKCMKDFTANYRHHFTPYMQEKIFTISPEFTWDIHQFMEELHKQDLRGESSNQNRDLVLPTPPQVHKQWEEGCPNLPVDFYDNEDGFWDSIISAKLKRYDQHKPMLRTRKHFTH